MSGNTSTPHQDKMFAVAPIPLFGSRQSWDFQPAVPSALSSSPIRATSPLSPTDGNTLCHREAQSSPIPVPKLKFAARPTRKNPVVRKREDAQESRRRLFLQNVRQRGEDRAWERRDVETSLSKIEWLNEVRELERAKQAAEPVVSEADIEDEAELRESDMDARLTEEFDEVMVEMMAQQEENAFDALISSFNEGSKPSDLERPASPGLSDDEYFDPDVIRIMLSQEPEQMVLSQEMDMS